MLRASPLVPKLNTLLVRLPRMAVAMVRVCSDKYIPPLLRDTKLLANRNSNVPCRQRGLDPFFCNCKLACFTEPFLAVLAPIVNICSGLCLCLKSLCSHPTHTVTVILLEKCSFGKQLYFNIFWQLKTNHSFVKTGNHSSEAEWF